MITIDYSKTDWQFVSRIMNENSRRLSRTVKGVSDTSTSQLKRPLLLSGDALAARAVENEARVHRLVHSLHAAPSPNSAADILRCLYEVADLTNDALLPAGRFRLWEISGRGSKPAKTPASELDRAVVEFSEEIFRRWQEVTTNPVSLAAWVEWELNGGGLHPFYDGCGRISRSFSAMVLIRGRCLLPLYENFDAYFAQGNKGLGDFTSYMTTRIAACNEWIRQAEKL